MRKLYIALIIISGFVKPCFSQKYHSRFKADIKTTHDHYRGRVLLSVTDSSLTILEPVRRGLFRVETREQLFASSEIRSIRIYRRTGPFLGAVAGYIVLGLGGTIAGAVIAGNQQVDYNNVIAILSGLVIGSAVGSAAGLVGGTFAGKAAATKLRIKDVNNADFAEISDKIRPFLAEVY